MNRISALFPPFSIAFGAIYVVCMHFNIAAFVYYPALGEFRAGMIEGSENGPPMFFFGWLLYALIGAAAFALATAVIPKNVAEKIWPSLVWIVPLGAIAVSAFFMRVWFIDVAG